MPVSLNASMVGMWDEGGGEAIWSYICNGTMFTAGEWWGENFFHL